MVEQNGTVRSSVVNLLNTIVGAGMLLIPLSLKTDGVLLGLIIIIIAGITSGFGLYLQGLSSKFLPNGEANFFNICSITYPSLSLLFDIAIAIQCFGVGLSYIVLIGDLMPTVVSVNVSNEGLFWILLSLVIIVPLVFLKNLDSLKYTSVVALLAIVYMLILVYLHFFFELSLELHGGKSPDKGSISLFKPESFRSILSTFSIIVFAYTGHQNMYSIINELKDRSIFTVNKISFISIPITALLFISVGISGYYTFGNNIGGNIILLYSDNFYTKIGRFSIVLMVLLSFPLMFHPCRISINNITFWIENKWRSQLNVSGEQLEPLVSGQEQPVAASKRPVLTDRRFFILTIVLLFASYLLALTLSSFEFILSIVGATGSTAISFILPGLFGYKLIGSPESENILQILEENHQYEDEANFDKIKKLFNSKHIKNLSLALTIWGCVVMVLCLYSSLYID